MPSVADLGARLGLRVDLAARRAAQEAAAERAAAAQAAEFAEQAEVIRQAAAEREARAQRPLFASPAAPPLPAAVPTECAVCLEPAAPGPGPICGDGCPGAVCSACLGRHLQLIVAESFNGAVPRLSCPACPQRLVPVDLWRAALPDEAVATVGARARAALSVRCGSCDQRRSLLDGFSEACPDPCERARRQLRHLAAHPRALTPCCAAPHCWACKSRWADGHQCAQRADDDVLPCVACGVPLARGDGCPFVTCVCGAEFNWERRVAEQRAAALAQHMAAHDGDEAAAAAAAAAAPDSLGARAFAAEHPDAMRAAQVALFEQTHSFSEAVDLALAQPDMRQRSPAFRAWSMERGGRLRAAVEAAPLLLLLTLGLERESMALVEEALAGYAVALSPLPSPLGLRLGVASVVGVVLRTDAPLAEVCALRPPLAVCALAGFYEDCGGGDFADYRAAARDAPFLEQAVALATPPGVERPSFRVSAVRTGSQALKSPEIGAAVGAGVVARLGLPVAMRGFDLCVVAVALEARLMLGVLLETACAGRAGKLPVERLRVAAPLVPDEHVVLREGTAEALLRAVGVRPGDVVLDPCGGVGTIPAVAALRFGARAALSSDLDVEMLPVLARNGVEGVVADAGSLPLLSACVDVVASDLPFGMRCGRSSHIKKLMPRLLREVARVLRPGGRFALLAKHTKAMRMLWEEGSVGRRVGLRLTEEVRVVVVLGLVCDLYVGSRV